MIRSNKIPEKKLAEITGRRFILRYDNDDEARKSSGSFHRDDYFILGAVRCGQYLLSVDFKDYQLSACDAIIISPGKIHASRAGCDGEGFVLLLASGNAEISYFALKKLWEYSKSFVIVTRLHT